MMLSRIQDFTDELTRQRKSTYPCFKLEVREKWVDKSPRFVVVTMWVFGDTRTTSVSVVVQDILNSRDLVFLARETLDSLATPLLDTLSSIKGDKMVHENEVIEALNQLFPEYGFKIIDTQNGVSLIKVDINDAQISTYKVLAHMNYPLVWTISAIADTLIYDLDFKGIYIDREVTYSRIQQISERLD